FMRRAESGLGAGLLDGFRQVAGLVERRDDDAEPHNMALSCRFLAARQQSLKRISCYDAIWGREQFPVVPLVGGSRNSRLPDTWPALRVDTAGGGPSCSKEPTHSPDARTDGPRRPQVRSGRLASQASAAGGSARCLP